jgi:hypothetical protein
MWTLLLATLYGVSQCALLILFCVFVCVCAGAEEGKEPVKEDGLENLKSKIE